MWEEREAECGRRERLENFQPYKPYQTKMMLETPTCQTALLLPLH